MRILTAVLSLALASCVTTTGDSPAYIAYLNNLQQQANAQGLPGNAILQAYTGLPLRPAQHITKAEKSQPEFTRTFGAYVGSMLSAQRIEIATQKHAENAQILARIERKTHVHSGTIVALWGLESAFGKAMGNDRTIPALASLGYTSPRASYFQKELFEALKVLNKSGKSPTQLIGSWAGAMGQCQFMPSNYLKYGTDGNADGKIDIWSTPADVFASTATFISDKGYDNRTPWRISLTTPINLSGVSLNPRGLSDAIPLASWQQRGLKGTPKSLPKNTKWRYFAPQEGAPPMLVGPNFEAILQWNNSSYFAYSVLALSDMIEHNK